MRKMNQLFRICLGLLLANVSLFGQDIRITHGPYLQAAGAEQVTIVWTTSKPAVSWVEVATAGSNSFYAAEHPKFFEVLHGKRTVGKLHRIKIDGLDPGTEYRYRVFSKEVLTYEGHRVLYGNIASTNVYTRKPLRFRTFDDNASQLAFSVVNDIHSHNDTLKALLKHVNLDETDLVFFNGDMVSAMNTEDQVMGGFMDAAVGMFAAEVPVFFVRGNHEARGPFSAAFPQYFPTGSGKPYYTLQCGPVFFIVLDCGEDKPDSDIEYSDLAQFDAYRSEQARWLKGVLDSPGFKSSPYRVALLHIPPYGSEWHGALDLRRKMVPLLNAAGITVMFSGHTHRYGYFPPQQGENNFPLLINQNNTALEITVKTDEMTILHKNTRGDELHRFVFYPFK